MNSKKSGSNCFDPDLEWREVTSPPMARLARWSRLLRRTERRSASPLPARRLSLRSPRSSLLGVAWPVHESTPRVRVCHHRVTAAHTHAPRRRRLTVSHWLRADCGTCGHRHGRARRARSLYQWHRSQRCGAGEAGEDAHGERGHAGSVLPQVWRPAVNSGARSHRGAANVLRWRVRVRQRDVSVRARSREKRGRCIGTRLMCLRARIITACRRH